MSPTLVLVDHRGRKYAVRSQEGTVRVHGLGAIDASVLESRIGRTIRIGDRRLLVLPASGRDFRETMERGAQTITPKDLAALLFEADIVAGARVVEAGSGSGGLTVALARAVGPEGRVLSFDIRPDALEVARANVQAAGVDTAVEFHQGDIRTGIRERDADAVVLDIEDPWSAVPSAWEALRPGGYLATFSPNMEQVKMTVAAIRALPFVDIRTVELIEREMEVREVGVRPSFAPLGHTGYLSFARKVLDTF